MCSRWIPLNNVAARGVRLGRIHFIVSLMAVKHFDDNAPEEFSEWIPKGEQIKTSVSICVLVWHLCALCVFQSNGKRSKLLRFRIITKQSGSWLPIDSGKRNGFKVEFLPFELYQTIRMKPKLI